MPHAARNPLSPGQGNIDGLKAAVHQQALQKRNAGSSASVLAGGSLDPVSDKERCCTVRARPPAMTMGSRSGRGGERHKYPQGVLPKRVP